jgi:ribonuclease BN (tRNA processing enzyme)
VTLLGTGDPLNDERAQASLAIHLAGGETMLLDTSSGTVLLQRLRAAGIALDSIRHVFVSHRHFDHAGGLPPLLLTLVSIPGAHLTVYAPPETLTALHEMLALTSPGVEDWLGDRLRWQALAPGQAVAAGSARVIPFAVTHGLECVGFRVQQAGRCSPSAPTRGPAGRWWTTPRALTCSSTRRTVSRTRLRRRIASATRLRPTQVRQREKRGRAISC